MSYLHWQTAKGYTEIKLNLPGISEKMLSQQLKELERDKLIQKAVITMKPYRVEYSLSPNGKELAPMYDFMSRYGIKYLQDNGIDYLKDQNLYK